jgi:polyhydroxybutyrate depolymerase
MTRRRFPIVLVIGFFVLILMGATHAPGTRVAGHGDESVDVNGVARTYVLHFPKSLDAKKSAPLVLVFHGGGGTGAATARMTGFNDIADREGFIVAYPDGLGRHWADFRGLSDSDDVGFIRTLIEKLERENNIDPRRVYATGISNGGFFSANLACILTDKIAAIASVAATMAEGEPEHCKPSKPISVLYIHGSKDPIVPIGGGPVARTRGVAVSQETAINFWKNFDQTSEKPETENFSSDNTTIHRKIYSGGKNGTEVVQYVIDGVGHVWPGGPQYLPAFIVGHATNAINASEVIWEFFKKNPPR